MTTAQPLDVQPTPFALLMLGREADPKSERGVDCTGELPAPSDPALVDRARAAKEKLGDKVFVLGHHYQRDEVIQFADVTGDSFKLARKAAARPEAEYIVFCGVHFMAEAADILTNDAQKVVLPDMAAAFTPMVYAIPVQLLAYHTAVVMGTDVDQPRNLAKSVTVE